MRAARYVLAFTCSASLARAAGPLGPNGAPIRTSDYGVDLSEGPVLGSSRVVGLGGAYVGIAEGTDGNWHNPASPAVRAPYSFDHVDYDLGVGFNFPSSLSGTDFYNTGERGTDLSSAGQSGFLFLDLGLNVQVGTMGFGLNVATSEWTLEGRGAGAGGTALDAEFLRASALVAQSVLDGDLVIGGGWRLVSLSLAERGDGARRNVFSSTGSEYQVGALVKPVGYPFRVGIALQSQVTSRPEGVASQGDIQVDSGGGEPLYLPRRVELPALASLGGALSLGPRPLNPRWRDPDDLTARIARVARWRAAERARRRARSRTDAARAAQSAEDAAAAALDQEHLEREERALGEELRARYRRLARSYLLITGGAYATGATDESVGVESFLQRRVNRSGGRPSWSWRLGVEGEPWPDVLKLRLGTYREPTRFEAAPATATTPASSPSARQHATAGIDVRLFAWQVFGLFPKDTVWRALGAVDRSERYFSWSVGVGLWH